MNYVFLKTLLLSGGGFLLTYAVAWNLAPNNQDSGGGSVSELDGVRSSQRINNSAKKQSESEIHIHTIKYAESKEERMKAVISLAYSYDVENFSKIINGEAYSLREGPEVDVLRQLIFERWRKEDLDSFIPWAMANSRGIANRELRLMAADSPELIMDYYHNHPNDKAELTSLEWIATDHPAMALERLRELADIGITSQNRYLVKKVAKQIAEKNDAELEGALAEFSSDMRRGIEEAIIGARLKNSFESQVQEL